MIMAPYATWKIWHSGLSNHKNIDIGFVYWVPFLYDIGDHDQIL